MSSSGDPIADFAAAMAARGLSTAKIIADGRMHTCDAGPDKAGKGDGRYILHLNGVPAGGFQNWRDGAGWENWTAKLTRGLTPEERRQNKARMEASRRARAQDEKARHADAAARAAAIWEASEPAPADHPYLVRKRVGAHGIRVSRGALVVPVQGPDGTLWSLQFIQPDGSKKFLHGGRVSGGYHILGVPNGRVCTAEGYATAATIHERTGHAVLVTFDCGNIHGAVAAACQVYTDALFTVCSDDDWRTDGNPGLTRGRAAAFVHRAFFATPVFGPARGDKDTDFNDMDAAGGDVAAAIAAAVLIEPDPPPAEPPPPEDQPPQHTDPVSALERRLSLGLDMNGRREALSNLNNAMLILERDPRVRDILWGDDFLGRIMTGDPPREWTDADDLNLTLYAQRELGIPKMVKQNICDAVIIHAKRNRKHCVKDWLATLTWDGVDRIGSFFPDFFGTESTPYTIAASRNFWLSICARVHRPGCKMDYMVVLEGSQGSMKSTAIQTIGGDWFTEQHESVMGKGFYEVIQGKLIVEVGEMDAFSRADITKVKQVITCPVDRYRVPWDKYASDHPRQNVFIGNTNKKEEWNSDETGARRFWPIRCVGEADIEGIARNRTQLFAEAWQLIKDGAQWWHMPKEETEKEQRARYNADIWHAKIAAFVASRSFVSLDEICEECLYIKTGDRDHAIKRRIGATLRFMGWTSGSKRVNNQVLNRWFAPE